MIKIMMVTILRNSRPCLSTLFSEKGLDIDGTREMLVTDLERSFVKSGEKRKRDEDNVAN